MSHEVLADCKDVAVLTKSIINEVCSKYRYPFFPEEIHIVISTRTKVSQDVRDYARQKKVKIIRLRY